MLSDEIKDKIDLIDFLSGYMKLHKAGNNVKALCPFHKENTPSFVANPDRQIWRCFGCGKGGDVIKFVMEFDNIEFVDALRVLAERAGIEMNKSGARDSNAVLYDIMRATVDFYRHQLKREKHALKYLVDRKLALDTINEFELGYAPSSFDALTKYLGTKGFRMSDAEKAGVILKSKNKGNYFDRFRGRIMFPIMNHIGKPVGFSGRITPQTAEEAKQKGREEPKYMNSSEGAIFHKSRILYGFYKSKIDIRKEDRAFLVEGQMDFLFSWQDGVRCAVATSGTALTEDHLSTLRNYTEHLVLGFDNDKAGAMAAERSIDMANELDFNVSVTHFEEFKDAADLVSARPGALAGRLDDTQSAMDYYFDRYIDKNADRLTHKKNIRTLLSKISHVGSPVEQSQWISELSRRTGIQERFLIEEMSSVKGAAPQVRTKSEDPGPENTQDHTEPRTRLYNIAEQVISQAFHHGDELLDKLNDHQEYLPEEYREVFNAREENGSNTELRSRVDLLVMRSALSENNSADEFDALLRHLKMEFIKYRQAELSRHIQEQEREGNTDEIESLLQELHSLSAELGEIMRTMHADE